MAVNVYLSNGQVMVVTNAIKAKVRNYGAMSNSATLDSEVLECFGQDGTTRVAEFKVSQIVGYSVD